MLHCAASEIDDGAGHRHHVRCSGEHCGIRDRKAVSDEAAERIATMKKQAMAETAEQLLAETGWLPPLLRTERSAWLTDEQPEAPAMDTAEGLPEAQNSDHFAVAAE